MQVRIDQIQVGERDRTDLGNIAELAASIEAVGLLHPVVVTEGMTLVAGDRRLSAVRHLGWTEVPVTVVDLETAADVLRAEADENTCRKPLTPYEASRARERRATVLADDAAKRKAETQAKPGEGRVGGAKFAPPKTVPEREESKTRKVAASGLGYSHETIRKVDRIRDVAERGVVRQGKTETPAPEPVREVARQALAEVKETGAAVDRAARQVEEALDRYVEESPDVKRAKFRRAWRSALSGAMELEKFDPKRVAEVLDGDEWTEVRLAVEALTKWYERLLAERSGGLRVVEGGRR